MTFDFAAAIAARPQGNTRAQLIATYGDPTADSTPHPTQRGWFAPGAKWAHRNLVSIPTADLPGFPPFGEQAVETIRLHRHVEPAFRATWAELVRRGLSDKLRTYSGAFAPRHMLHDPRRPVSVHAYGAAIDFEAAWNGYGVPLERAGINREVVRCFEECGWEWGGRWGEPDAMHFQWTAPLHGVKQVEWRDAMGRVPPTPPALPTGLIAPGQYRHTDGREWYQVHEMQGGVPVPLPGVWDSVVRHPEKGMRLVRVERDKLAKAGLL